MYSQKMMAHCLPMAGVRHEGHVWTKARVGAVQASSRETRGLGCGATKHNACQVARHKALIDDTFSMQLLFAGAASKTVRFYSAWLLHYHAPRKCKTRGLYYETQAQEFTFRYWKIAALAACTVTESAL